MRRTKRRKKGPVQAKKVSYDGINFASGLERYMYMALKKAKIKAEYEGETFVLQEGFDFTSIAYERQANGKGDMINRGQKSREGSVNKQYAESCLNGKKCQPNSKVVKSACFNLK